MWTLPSWTTSRTRPVSGMPTPTPAFFMAQARPPGRRFHGFVVIGLHRLQRFHQSRGAVHDLTVGQDAAGSDGIAVADLPRGNTHLVRHFVQQRFNAEAGLGHAEAPEGSGRGIVRIVGPAVDLIGFVLIRARAVGAGPFQHRPAQRGVGPGVGDALRRHALNDAVFIAAQREFHLHGVTLGMDQQTFRPGELHLYRALCEIGDQRGVVLDRYVLLPPKPPPTRQLRTFTCSAGRPSIPMISCWVSYAP